MPAVVRMLVAASLLVLACSEPHVDRAERAPLGERTAAPPEATPSCLERIDHALAGPSLRGTPALDAARAQIFASAKAEPVLFVERPEPAANRRDDARVYAGWLAQTRHPWDVLGRLLPVFSADPEVGRQSLLRDGYLYTESPALAYALYDRVEAHHLFGADRIWIERGERTRWATRTASGRYVWEAGEYAGRPARLLLFDRVGDGSPPAPMHRDLRSLRDRLHFDRLHVRHLGADRIVVDLRYGDERWIPTLLDSRNARLEVACEALPSELQAEIEIVRERGDRMARALSSLRRAMLVQIEEALPFDEPLTEVGQQDGRLRTSWVWAYQNGKDSFRFDVDHYPVFDARGRPRPPQVCIDFVLDSFERASGSWWAPRGGARERLRGALDFDDHDRENLRKISSFLEFAQTHPEWFEVWTPPSSALARMGALDRLAASLSEHADEFRSGDIVFVHGMTPWDEHEPHYHAFFVYETDPMTGFPLVVVGNAGTPTIRVWRVEANRTPKRAIVRRVRPKLEWMESIFSPTEVLAPPPLLAGATHE